MNDETSDTPFGATGPDPPDTHRRLPLELVEGRLVVIKRPHPDVPEASTRVINEAVILESLSHPNVVELIDAIDVPNAGPEIHLAVAGRHTLADKPPITAAEVAAAMRDLMTYVGELHEFGVTHGSLGADHVVVGPSGRLCLISFGRGTPRGSGATTHDAGTRSDLAGLGSMMSHLVFLLPDDASRNDRRGADTLSRLASRLRDDPSPTTAARVQRELAVLAGDRRSARASRGGRFGGRSKGDISPRPQPRAEAQQRRSARLMISTTTTTPANAQRWGAPVAALGIVCLIGVWMVGGGPPGLGFAGSAASSRSVTDVAVEAFRAVALAASVYLATIGLVSVVAHRVGSVRAARWVDSAAPRWLRRTAVAFAGVGVLAAMAPNTSESSTGSARGHQAAADAGPPRTSPPSSPSSTADRGTGPIPTSSIPPSTTETTSTLSEHASPEVPPAANVDPAGGPDPDISAVTEADLPNMVVVGSGDHLWSIAEAALTTSLGRAPSDAEIDPYWRAVVEINRENLEDPDNPDLLFSGQVIELPPND